MKNLKGFWDLLNGNKTKISAVLMSLLLVNPVQIFLGEWYQFAETCVHIFFGLGLFHAGAKQVGIAKKPNKE